MRRLKVFLTRLKKIIDKYGMEIKESNPCTFPDVFLGDAFPLPDHVSTPKSTCICCEKLRSTSYQLGQAISCRALTRPAFPKSVAIQPAPVQPLGPLPPADTTALPTHALVPMGRFPEQYHCMPCGSSVSHWKLHSVKSPHPLIWPSRPVPLVPKELALKSLP